MKTCNLGNGTFIKPIRISTHEGADINLLYYNGATYELTRGPKHLLSLDYSMTDIGVGTLSAYAAGYYQTEDASAVIDAGTGTDFGYVTSAYGAHAFVVTAGAGTGSGTLTVSGYSITDANPVPTPDSEVIVAEILSCGLNDYYESTKKWLGTVNFKTSANTLTANYGLCKYEDAANTNFEVITFECVGLSRANSTNVDIQLIHHTPIGWTYDATDFNPGPTPFIASLAADYQVLLPAPIDFNVFRTKDYFAYKRTDLDHYINGAANEGVVIKYNQTTSNSFRYMNFKIGIRSV